MFVDFKSEMNFPRKIRPLTERGFTRRFEIKRKNSIQLKPAWLCKKINLNDGLFQNKRTTNYLAGNIPETEWTEVQNKCCFRSNLYFKDFCQGLTETVKMLPLTLSHT